MYDCWACSHGSVTDIIGSFFRESGLNDHSEQMGVKSQQKLRGLIAVVFVLWECDPLFMLYVCVVVGFSYRDWIKPSQLKVWKTIWLIATAASSSCYTVMVWDESQFDFRCAPVRFHVWRFTVISFFQVQPPETKHGRLTRSSLSLNSRGSRTCSGSWKRQRSQWTGERCRLIVCESTCQA